MTVKEEAKGIGAATLVVIWAAVILFGIAAAWQTGALALLPMWRNQETQVIRNSNEYVSTKQTLLLKLAADGERLEAEIAALGRDPQNASVVDGKQRQLTALVARMRSEAALIRPEQVPADVSAWLR